MNHPKHVALALVQDDRKEIEKELERNLTPYLDVVKKAASHILFSGGKRLRPMLMVLSARICGYNGKYDKTFSIIFEYLHAASLLHDDLAVFSIGDHVDSVEFRADIRLVDPSPDFF